MHTTPLLPAPPARSTISVVVSALWRLRRSHDEAYAIETQFDGGEFSGPAISAGYERAARAALAEHGWTACELDAELTSRTSARWAYEVLGELVGDLYGYCSQCGEKRDIERTTVTPGFDPSVVCHFSCGHVEL